MITTANLTVDTSKYPRVLGSQAGGVVGLKHHLNRRRWEHLPTRCSAASRYPNWSVPTIQQLSTISNTSWVLQGSKISLPWHGVTTRSSGNYGSNLKIKRNISYLHILTNIYGVTRVVQWAQCYFLPTDPQQDQYSDSESWDEITSKQITIQTSSLLSRNRPPAW